MHVNVYSTNQMAVHRPPRTDIWLPAKVNNKEGTPPTKRATDISHIPPTYFVLLVPVKKRPRFTELTFPLRTPTHHCATKHYCTQYIRQLKKNVTDDHVRTTVLHAL